MTVDGERGHTLLRIGSQGGSKVHGTGTLRAVEAPDGLGRAVVGLEGLRDVAPARGNNQRATHIVLRELLIGGGSLGRATDASVSNNTLDGLTVGVLHVRLNEGGSSLGHVHGLILQRLTNAEAAAVNRRANPDGRQCIVFHNMINRWVKDGKKGLFCFLTRVAEAEAVDEHDK